MSSQEDPNPAAHSAADQNPLDRPGVPQEQSPPAPLGNAHWLRPEQQRSESLPVIGHGRPLTPVYSTENPPRALSGLIRRAAYRVPDYRVRRWVMLIVADRLDVWESNPLRLVRGVALLSVLGLGVYGARRLLRSS